MSKLFAAASAASALRVPVWSRPPETVGRFTAWGQAPEPEPQAFNDDLDEDEQPSAAEAPSPAIDVEALRAESFTEGYAAGLEAGGREAEAEKAALHKLAIGLEMLRPEPTQGLGAMIAATVERLLHEVMGEVEVPRELLVERAQAAAAMIGEETRPSRLRLNPADVARLAGAELPVPVEADASLGAGELRLDTGVGTIEDGPSVRLARLRAALDRIATAR